MDATPFLMPHAGLTWDTIYNNFVNAVVNGDFTPHLSDESSAGLVALNGATIEKNYTNYRYIDFGGLRLVNLQVGLDIPQSEQGSKDTFAALQIPESIMPVTAGNVINSTDNLGSNYQLTSDGKVTIARSRTDGLHSDWGYYTSFIYFAANK